MTKIDQILEDAEKYFKGEESKAERLISIDIVRAKNLVYSLTLAAKSVLMECHNPQPLIEEHCIRVEEIKLRIDEIIEKQSS